MAESFKIVNQTRPAAATLTDAYTVPVGAEAVISSIIVSNTSGSTDLFRISIAQDGAVDALSQYLYYDISISKNNTFSAVLGVTLDASDVVRVYSRDGDLNFHLYGVELT